MKTNGSISFPNSPTYDFIFPFEERYDVVKTMEWMNRHWTLSVYIGAFYLAAIFGGQYYMRDRPPFNVRKILIVWNVLLSVFSLLGALRTVPELVYVLKEFGLHHSVCVRVAYENKISLFWGWAFVMSKLPELADTAFVVARKQKLVVLHWFHHVVTLCICWCIFSDAPSLSRWMICINFSIHAVMYAYYALRSIGFAVSRTVALFITTTQIAQMVLGLVGACYGAVVLRNGGHCQMKPQTLAFILFGYGTFFVLFVNFFVHSYVFNKRRPLKRDSKKYS